MPYDNNQDLPDPVRNHLPEHGQEIYRKAFNSALEEYKDPAKRRDDASEEEIAHKVAWNAVKTKYYKGEDGNWKLKGE